MRAARRVALLAGALALGLAAPAGAAHPDLVSDPPESPELEVAGDPTGGERLLLRFDGHVHNAGTGAFEIERVDGVGVLQRVFDSPTTFTRTLAPDAMKFENTDGHNHWHLQRAARYSLWNDGGTHEVAPALKVGFCLVDSERIGPGGPADDVYRNNCGFRRPTAASVKMGVSGGWRDLYPRRLPFQWVDVSEVQPGSYELQSHIDPDDQIAEADEANNGAGITDVVVPGYVARPAAATGAASSLTLAPRTALGADPLQLRHRVVDAPEHGTVRAGATTVDGGAWFAGTALQYTGTGAADRFVVVADDALTDYPRHPARATVLAGGTETTERVAMAGLPVQMLAGTSVELDATAYTGAAAATRAITWSAPGAAIDGDGRLTAPAQVPAAGLDVTVTATDSSGAQDAMTVRVVRPPVPKPAPQPPAEPTDQGTGTPAPTDAAPATPIADQPTGTPPQPPTIRRTVRRTPVGSVRVRRIGPNYAVAITSRASGRVRASLLARSRRLSSCVVRVRAGRSALCRLPVRRGATAIALTLVKRTGGTERRRVSVPRARS